MHRIAPLGPRAHRLRMPFARRPSLRPQCAPISTLRGRDVDVHVQLTRPHHRCIAASQTWQLTSANLDLSTRSFWSPADLAAEAAQAGEASTQPSSPLHVPPIAPANISASSLIEPSTLEALVSLPECQSVIDILNGVEEALEPSRVREARSNLQRARDILQSMPELHLATHLLEVDLLCFCGKFDLALEGLSRYEHTANSIDEGQRMMLQFLKAKLMVHAGRFAHALSEYECLLEDMEREVQAQVQLQQQKEQGGDDGAAIAPLPVIHAASALTGVGASKLLVHIRDGSDGHGAESDEGEIFESIETATDMLLESRKDALLSPKHSQLAVDLGLAASISLTNLGVAHCLLHNDKAQSMACWKKGVETLDSILEGAMRSATVIPTYQHQCMEGVRARLYCNISWALLGDDGSLDDKDEETLKRTSEAAKKALDIYDELMQGSKVLRGGGLGVGGSDDDKKNEGSEEDATSKEEWERILKEKAEEQKEHTNGLSEVGGSNPSNTPLSSLWSSHHKAESARALGLVARCYAAAGAAVTAEGLFQSALDASASCPLGQKLKPGGSGVNGVSVSSPSLGLIARDVRLWYAALCDNWEKRGNDAERLRADAQRIENEGVLRGFVRDEDGNAKSVLGLVSSLWLFCPLDFDR